VANIKDVPERRSLTAVTDVTEAAGLDLFQVVDAEFLERNSLRRPSVGTI